MERHHKLIIGSFSSIVFIFMITAGILLYVLFTQQTINYNTLSTEIADTQSKINELSTNLLQTKETISSINSSIKTELQELKSSASPDFSEIIESSIESVVTVKTDVAQGTGFIITDDGYIVTNAHVLVDGRAIQTITSEGGLIEAEFIGYNSNFDIALLKIEGEYDALNLANSDNIDTGEKVIAIGNPLGLQFSVSEGIVSATHRVGINGVKAYIQTDAALNPGNSGGPLINKNGDVIGINNFKISAGESLGFALESNYIEEIVNEISEDILEERLL